MGRGRFLAALTVYKATADVARGGRMFEERSSVPDAMLPWRSTVIAFKQPRRQLVQPVTRIEGDTVILQVRPALRLCRVALAVPCLSLALPPEPSAPTTSSTFTEGRNSKRRLQDCARATLRATGHRQPCALCLTLCPACISFSAPSCCAPVLSRERVNDRDDLKALRWLSRCRHLHCGACTTFGRGCCGCAAETSGCVSCAM